MFGDAPAPQDEDSPLRPRSPYAGAKVYAHFMTRNYREAHGMFAVSGILFNHESPRRGESFVTRKITRAVARIKEGLDRGLRLGNLRAVRDWGYAPEYADAMWRMLQQPEPDDYVIATGVGYSVEQFAAYAFAHAGLDWAEHVSIDATHLRPLDVGPLVGNAHKAERVLGWKPRTFAPELAQLMVDADLRTVRMLGRVER
jgi:GDPmannose 4,6-dehydratase